MTSEEIDQLVEEMRRVGQRDAVGAFHLAEKIIEACVAAGYLKHLPRTRMSRANYLFRTKGNHDELPSELLSALKLAHDLGQREDEAEGFISLGYMEGTRGNLTQAREYFEQAQAIASAINDWRGVANATHGIAHLLQDQGLNELAINHMRQAHEMTRGTELESGPLGGLAELFEASGDYRAALELETRVLELRRGKPLGESFAHSFIAMMHTKLGEYDLAKEHYLEGYRLAEEQNDAGRLAWSLYAAGECEILTGEFELAEENLQRASGILAQSGSAYCYLALARLALRRSTPEVALEQIKMVEGIYANTGRRSLMDDVHKLYAEAYEQLGEWKKVAYHEKERRRVNDEMNSSKFKAQLSETQIILATERQRKETEVQKLRAELSERELANTTLQLVAHTNRLAEFRDSIREIAAKMPPTEATVRELRAKIKELAVSGIDWKKYDEQFKAAYPEFTAKLMEQYPTLSPTELRVCALLRMNLKSEEIARLFSVTDRAVEFHRLNIRKKMGLKTKENLSLALTKM